MKSKKIMRSARGTETPRRMRGSRRARGVGCRKPGLTANSNLFSTPAEDRALSQSHHDCTPTPSAPLIAPGGSDKGRVQSGGRLIYSSSVMSAAVSAFGDRFLTNSGNGGSRMCPPWSQLSISHVAQYVLRRPSGTATGLWLRQEVRGFRRSSVWEASLSVRKGMRGAARGVSALPLLVLLQHAHMYFEGLIFESAEGSAGEVTARAAVGGLVPSTGLS
ncbi:hypothetical protein Q8A73_018619 [Channa argus]|nr:hypothetical protein Q8A73_018619 [Channa argus]